MAFSASEKILITGAAGMLGTAVLDELSGSRHTVVATDSQASPSVAELNVMEWRAVRKSILEHKPTLVLHLAAETNVDRCEEEPDHAYLTNTAGTENVVRACEEIGSELVYISTGSVFSGSKSTPYTEYDQPDPINVYARSKLLGEEIVARSSVRSFTFRAGWMVGGWNIDKKFVFKIVQMVKEGRPIKAVDDKFGSPTFTWDFAHNLFRVVQTGRHGLYHMCNNGTASRYEIAQAVVEYMGAKDSVSVSPVPSTEFPLPAPRPDSEMMRNLNLDANGLNHMPPWRESLRAYIIDNAEDQAKV